MLHSELISSLQNPKIKHINRLIEKSAERKSEGFIVVEGKREIALALSAGHEIASLFYCEDIAGPIEHFPADQIFPVTKDVFAKIAYRENSDGLLAIIKPVFLALEDLILSDNPLLMVLEAVEKPGNLGAVLRTADAAKMDALIVCDLKTDLFNPNVIRSSVGCVFTVPMVVCSSEELFHWLQKYKITAYAAALTANDDYHHVDFCKPAAIILGTEATGLSDYWLANASQIKIPMSGKIDSLNVSNAAAILAFEAKRQRGFK